MVCSESLSFRHLTMGAETSGLGIEFTIKSALTQISMESCEVLRGTAF